MAIHAPKIKLEERKKPPPLTPSYVLPPAIILIDGLFHYPFHVNFSTFFAFSK
ncbi:hypothetical protein BSM4216_3228 [Bacillus smithii]|nr:hypothetical protein BSM4216_3228 [Bacillus smithii]